MPRIYRNDIVYMSYLLYPFVRAMIVYFLSQTNQARKL